MFPDGVNSRKGKNTWSLLRLVSRLYIYIAVLFDVSYWAEVI